MTTENRLGTKIPDLPAGLGDTGQLAAVCHLAEAHAGDTELLEGTAGAAVDLVAVTHANGGSVAGQLLQCHACCFALLGGSVLVDQGLLQRDTLLVVASDDDLALLIASDLGLLSHS